MTIRPMLVSALLGATLLSGHAHAQSQPDFELPFPCRQAWQGTTDANATPPHAIEFSRPSYGNEPVLASAPGTIAAVRDLGYGSSTGRYIAIDHGAGWRTTYMNLASFNVVVGERVAGGQPIATVGKSAPHLSHLYYEQRYYGLPQSVTLNGRKAYYWGTYGYVSQNCRATHQ